MQRVLLPDPCKYHSDPYREGKMSYMKTEDIKALNEIGFTTPDLEAWVIAVSAFPVQFGARDSGDVANEIVSRLRELDELKARYVLLQKRHEDLYERLSAFAEKLGDSLA